jgi:hypothetical protein
MKICSSVPLKGCPLDFAVFDELEQPNVRPTMTRSGMTNLQDFMIIPLRQITAYTTIFLKGSKGPLQMQLFNSD